MAAVQDSDSLSDVDKFDYLRGLLERTALEAISGLSLTSAKCCEAVTILEQRFGNKSQIVARHMDILIHGDLSPLLSISRDSVDSMTWWNQTSKV